MKTEVEIIKENIKNCRKDMDNCNCKGNFQDLEMELEYLKNQLDELSFGECENCYRVLPIERGCNFIFNFKKSEWFCNKCYDVYVGEFPQGKGDFE